MDDVLPAPRSAAVLPGRLLLVEDDDGDALLVEELLAEVGSRYELVRARSLEQARPYLSDGVGCVLLDLGLPDAEGLQALHEVLLTAGSAAVVCLTGLDDEHRGAAAVASGAQDYLVKGSVDGPLLLRAVRYAVERRAAQEQARQLYATRLQAEHNARLERGLLPRPQTRDPALLVTARYLPGRQALLSGDFFDVIETGDGRVCVLLGDVAGTGPDEAALGVCIRIAWRSLVLAGVDEERVLPLLEEVLVRERRSPDVFVTLTVLVVAADRRSARLRLAEHLSPLLLADGTGQMPADRRGPALGLLPGSGWAARDLELPERWRVLLFTDGLVEGRRDGGPHRLGVPGLVELADALADTPADKPVADRLVEQVQRSNGGALTDDVALVELSWSGPDA